MRLFIDTNIIVEYIEHRQQYDSVPIGISRTDMLNAVFNHDFNDLEDSFQFQTAAQKSLWYHNHNKHRRLQECRPVSDGNPDSIGFR